MPHSNASRGRGETGWAVNNRPRRAGGFQAWDTDQNFKRVISSPTRRWDGGGGGGYCCSGFRTGAGATLVPLLHGDREAASGEPVGPQGFLR